MKAVYERAPNGMPEQVLVEAKTRGWTMVDMNMDMEKEWKHVFHFETT
jgi:hypothetical protein